MSTTRGRIDMTGPTLEFSKALHAEKYRGDGESFRESMNRIAGALTESEDQYHKFREIIGGMRFLPAGRIQTAVGSTKNVTPYNCFVSGTIEDSFVAGNGSIMERAKEAASTMRMGGGIGYDFSTLRPKGALIKKLQSSSSGPISFMGIFNAVCKCVASSGHRRGAQMGVMRIDHPDIEEFIHAKQNQDSLTGFNISIAVTDEFMQCLETSKLFDLKFGNEVYKQVDPAALWENIMRSTWDYGEPGVLFIDRINEENNLNYCETIAATNPCVTGDTPILTMGGWIKIESLVGCMVDVWNGEEWSTVEPRLTGKNQNMVTVVLSNGQKLNCTKSHVFHLSDGIMVDASELQEGDELLDMDWPVVENGQDYRGAYTQGCFAGDGWYASKNRPYISFKREDKKALEPFIDHFNAYDTKTGYRYLYLKDNIKLPKDFVPIYGWSVKSRLDWLAGLLDTDGTATWSYDRDGKKSSCSLCISSVNEGFIDNVALLLRTLGVSTNRDVDTRRREWSKSPTCYRIAVKSSLVLRLTDLGLHTHRIDLTHNNPRSENFVSLRVQSVQDAGTAESVYCFTEPKNNTGCFNGILTGQCGEQPLPPYGACLLGSFNLVQYLNRGVMGDRSFNWEQFKADIPMVVRAMDRVVDVAIYPLYEQEKEAKSKRRMGLGVTGLANALEYLGMPYGSPEFLKFEHNILEMLAVESYRSSAMLAKEKGSFLLYDKAKYLSSPYLKRVLPVDVLKLIHKYGIRNSHLTSVAPTGTISMSADNVSSGVEPVFSYSTDRIYIGPDGPEQVTIEDYGYSQLNVRGKQCKDVTVAEHLSVLTVAARLVDSAVSKTLNVPANTPWADFKGIYTAAWMAGCKGCTTFQTEGKRKGILKENSDNVSCYIDPDSGQKECG